MKTKEQVLVRVKQAVDQITKLSKKIGKNNPTEKQKIKAYVLINEFLFGSWVCDYEKDVEKGLTQIKKERNENH